MIREAADDSAPGSARRTERAVAADEVGVCVRPDGRYFDPAAVGRDVYQKVMSNVSRAVARLAARGLVARPNRSGQGRWAGVAITEAGREWLRDRGLGG